MPIYEYQCPHCKAVKEELNDLGTELHSIGCLVCLSPMKRIISAPNGLVRGTSTPTRTDGKLRNAK